MRRLIESLTPVDRPMSWTWIGGMLAFYVVVMTAAVTVYAGHRAENKSRPQTGATVASGSKPSARETATMRQHASPCAISGRRDRAGERVTA